MKRNIYLIAIHNFLIDFRFFAPILVLYFAKVSGSYTLAMSVFSVIFISSAFFEIPTGFMSDRLGRKWTLVIGCAANLIGLIVYALAGSYFVLLMGAVFEGFSRALYSGNNNALLHDTLDELGQKNKYHHLLGKLSSLFQIAAAFAAILGGFMAAISFQLVMWASVIPQILNTLICLFVIEPKETRKEAGNIYQDVPLAIKYLNKSSRIRKLSLSKMINLGLGNAAFEFQVAFYELVWPTWALGIARTIANSVGAVGYWMSGKLIDRFSAIRVLIVESITVPISKIVASIIPSPISPVIMASGSIMYGPSSVASETLLQNEYSDSQRATLGSIISLGASIINAVSSIIFGFMADQYGVIIAIVFAQVLLFSTTFIHGSIKNIPEKTNN